jgi:hypothetical protein
LLAQYGDRLGCVRYRYDAQRRRRFKRLRVAFVDVALPNRVKHGGGTWNPALRVWQLRYDRAVAFGLDSRIVDRPTVRGSIL